MHQWTHFFLCLLCDPSPYITFFYFVPFVLCILVPYNNFLWLDLWFGIFYHVIKWSIPPLVLSDVDTYIMFMILNDLSLFHQQLWIPTNSFSFCFYLILVWLFHSSLLLRSLPIKSLSCFKPSPYYFPISHLNIFYIGASWKKTSNDKIL